ncbi:hypothetical protein KCP74_04400 [Salmonella enterica subsp. enterica]|nr:hypothetical protein KCP74_04400 [Salmonella enterica subsp. enterica]
MSGAEKIRSVISPTGGATRAGSVTDDEVTQRATMRVSAAMTARREAAAATCTAVYEQMLVEARRRPARTGDLFKS